MTTKKVYVACDGIEFYDEDKCRKYEDELDNLQVKLSFRHIPVIDVHLRQFVIRVLTNIPLAIGGKMIY